MKKVDVNNIKDIKEKGNGFINEFKAFVLRGNVMDMAIGVIIGGAFQSIVTALTSDFINPLINCIGGAEVGGKIQIFHTGQYILYGDFITSVINFVIMAFVLFCLLKIVNGLVITNKKKKEETTAVVKSDEVILLEEIRNLLKEQNKKSK